MRWTCEITILTALPRISPCVGMPFLQESGIDDDDEDMDVFGVFVVVVSLGVGYFSSVLCGCAVVADTLPPNWWLIWFDLSYSYRLFKVWLFNCWILRWGYSPISVFMVLYVTARSPSLTRFETQWRKGDYWSLFALVVVCDCWGWAELCRRFAGEASTREGRGEQHGDAIGEDLWVYIRNTSPTLQEFESICDFNGGGTERRGYSLQILFTLAGQYLNTSGRKTAFGAATPKE